MKPITAFALIGITCLGLWFYLSNNSMQKKIDKAQAKIDEAYTAIADCKQTIKTNSGFLEYAKPQLELMKMNYENGKKLKECDPLIERGTGEDCK